MTQSDASLVERTVRQDRNAYGVLVNRYRSAVLAQTLAVTGRSADAEDLAQDAFVKAYQALPGLKRPGVFAAWLFGITRNVCLDWLRRRMREQAAANSTPAAAEPADQKTDTPPKEAQRRERHRLVWTAVATLPTEYAVTVTLKHQAGLTCQEIADRLEVPIGTVTSRLARAHQMLRERLAHAGVVPADAEPES
jgi:RNA polymerase sigma-70 factor (ECF subfamily)